MTLLRLVNITEDKIADLEALLASHRHNSSRELLKDEREYYLRVLNMLFKVLEK